MKKAFAKIHLWLSLPFGIIIAIVCLSGAVLVFEDEILELTYPSRYFVEEVKEKPLTPAELIASGRKQLPDSIKINGIRVTADPNRTYQLVLPGKKAAAFIDPYTGRVTGIDDGQGFFMQTMRLHRWLLDTYKRDGSFSWGKSLVGYSTLVFVVIVISGIVMWWPRSKKALKNRLKIKTNAGWRRFFYDLHVTAGFYSALLLLVLALTGLTWSFGWFRDAFYTAFGVKQQTEQQAATSTQPVNAEKGNRERTREGVKNSQEKGSNDRSKDTNTSENEKKSQKKEVDYLQWAEVLANLQNSYEDYNSITIQNGSATVSTAQYGNTRGSDSYSFDPSNGQITKVQLYKDLPKSGKIRGWIYSVHVGSWGGMTMRILSFLVSVLATVFVFTGYYFWIKKSLKKRSRKAKKIK